MSQLKNLLHDYGVEQYLDLFRNNRIDVDVLQDVTESDLRDLGIPLGDRKRLLRLIRDQQDGLVGEIPKDNNEPDDYVRQRLPSDIEQAEIRQITVLFADLVGSTQLAEQLDIEDNHALLIQFQELCSEIVSDCGGYPIREVGDGLLACFGFPKAHEDDAERAAISALRMTTAIPKIAEHETHDLSVRIGIATGMAVTNDLLLEGQTNISPATGAIFNLAARIQSLAEPSTVLIDQDTRRILADKFSCEDAGQRALKGFSENKQTWQLISVRQRLSLPDEIKAQTLYRMVGRSEELDFLRLRWQASGHKSHVILVTGEPGIGKSRLVNELFSEIAPLSRDIIWMQCSADDTLRPFHSIIQSIEDVSGLAALVEPEERQRRFDTWVKQVQQYSPMAAKAFGHLLSLTDGSSDSLNEVSPIDLKRTIFEALLQLFKQLASDFPILVVVEDIHWIDPSTEEFLDYLYNHLSDLKILLICTYRPDYRPNFVGEPSVSLISLTRLGENQASRIVKEVLGDARLPPDVAEEIISRTDGVPLFLEELTKSVVESRAQGARAGRRVANALSEWQVQLPTTLLGSLTARLDRIPDAKRVAPVGAAIGRNFSLYLLLAVFDWPEIKVASVLDRLVASGLLTRSGSAGSTIYRFKHSLVQDAAYQTLTKSRRALLHGRIGEALEGYAPGAKDARPETLARHFFLANEQIKACGYWLLAAKDAQRSSAGKEAVAYIESAIAANLQSDADDGQRDREIELREALYVALQVANWGSSKIESNMERLLELRSARGEVDDLLDVLHAQSGYHIICGNVRKAKALAQEILDRYTDDLHARFLALRCLGFCSFLSGDLDQAIAELAEVISLDDEVDQNRIKKFYQADTLTIAQAMICWAYAWKGEINDHEAAEALVWAKLDNCDDRWTKVYALMIIASARQTIGDGDKCADLLALATPIAREIDSDYWMAWGLFLSGWVKAIQGSAAQGIHNIEDGIKIYRSTGSSQTLPYAKTLLVEALILDRRFEDAQDILEELSSQRQPPEVRYVDSKIERLADILKDQTQIDRPASQTSVNRDH